MTFEELVAAIAEKTGEHPRHVEHLVRAWIRDGLLPRPKIVPVPGKRGTRGDYGEATLIGYLVIKALRPKGKPLSLAFIEPDWEDIWAKTKWFLEYGKWLEREFGFRIGQIEALEKANALPPPPPELVEKRQLLEKRPKRKPAVRRVRLNTETLARLMPIARGEKPNDLLFNLGEKTPRELAEETGEDVWKLYLEWKALREIWKAVCKVETGMNPDRIDSRQGDVVAYLDGKEIWRLSQSKWAAKN